MRRRLVHFSQRLQRSALALPVAVLVAGSMLAISEIAHHQSATQLRALNAMSTSRTAVMDITLNAAVAESSQRGYLLTDRTEYLAPYDAAKARIESALKRLADTDRQLTAGHTDAVRVQLEEAVRRKLSEMDEVLRLQRNGQRDAAYTLQLSGIGRESMEQMRERSDELLQRQNTFIDAGRSYLFDTMFLTRVGIAAMTSVSLLVLVLYLRLTRNHDQERAERAAELVAERDRLEQDVLRRTTDLTELARHLESAREDERARLARELHDELGALLTTAKLDVARIRPKMQQSAPDQIERLAHLTETLNSGIALKRRIIEDLRPSTLDNLGLRPALEILCNEFAERANVTVLPELAEVSLARSAQLTVYRLVQESLTNVAKYAKARQVQVRMRQVGDEVIVQVQDDGVGFDLTAVPRATHGLLGMRYRVESEGGSYRVKTAVGQGTEVEAMLPAVDAVQPEELAA